MKKNILIACMMLCFLPSSSESRAGSSVINKARNTVQNARANLSVLQNNVKNLNKKLTNIKNVLTGVASGFGSFDGTNTLKAAVDATKIAATSVEGKLGSFASTAGSTLKDAVDATKTAATNVDGKLGSFTSTAGSTLKDAVTKVESAIGTGTDNPTDVGTAAGTVQGGLLANTLALAELQKMYTSLGYKPGEAAQKALLGAKANISGTLTSGSVDEAISSAVETSNANSSAGTPPGASTTDVTAYA